MRQCWKLVLAIVGIARLADAGLTSPHHAVAHSRDFAAAAEATYAAIATATAGATRNQSRHQLTSSTSMTAPPAIPKTFRSMVSITSTDSNTAGALFGSVYTVAQNDVKKRQAFRSTTKVRWDQRPKAGLCPVHTEARSRTSPDSPRRIVTGHSRDAPRALTATT